MKKSKYFVLPLLCAFALGLTGCTEMIKKVTMAAIEQVTDHEYKDSEKLGKVVTQTLDATDVSRVKIMGAVKFVFVQDSTVSATVTGNEKSIEAYDFETEDGKLRVELKNGTDKMDKNTPRLTVRLCAPSLSEVRGSGALVVESEGEIRLQNALEINVSGAADIDLDNLQAEALLVDVDGAAEVDLDEVSCTGDAEFRIDGAGELEGAVECQQLTVQVNGAGDVDLAVRCNVADVSCQGAGKFRLSGECQKLRKSMGHTVSFNAKELKVAEE